MGYCRQTKHALLTRFSRWKSLFSGFTHQPIPMRKKKSTRRKLPAKSRKSSSHTNEGARDISVVDETHVSEAAPPSPAFQSNAEVAVPVEDVKLPDELPILGLRGLVVFPGTIVPLQVGRASSLKLLEDALPHSKLIGLALQNDPDDEEPDFAGMQHVGTAVSVLKIIRQADDTVTAIVHALRRIRLIAPVQEKPYLKAKIKSLPHPSVVRMHESDAKEFHARVNRLRTMARELIELTPGAPEQALTVVLNIADAGGLADYLAANIDITPDERQGLLAEPDVVKRVYRVHDMLVRQLEMARLQNKIGQDTQKNITESQRKYFLAEQLKAIQKELGEGNESEEVIAQLKKKIEKAKLPEKVAKEAEKEIKRLEVIPSGSPEYSVTLSYLELIADLPWSVSAKEAIGLPHAKQVLNRDHFGLDKVKKRLLEYLAVRKLNPEGRGPILCLVGPPGVGKTSLGVSIAESMNRPFARLALGGIRDEAEIRGHRRTYIGAMPGRLIQELKRAGANNPVIMLDEIDKLGADSRGDPSSALLEVLDPRQNHAFVDRYLDVPFDLSKVLFICTANTADQIPAALYDRLEVIEVSGYTDHDKAQIAKQYLVPRQMKENGLKSKDCAWTVDGVAKVIENYTREAGVRELERQVGNVCRAIAARVATHPKHAKTTVDAKFVVQVLGGEKFVRDLDTRCHGAGTVVGLAYTSVGGEILFIEAAKYPGKGGLVLTGQLGDVMKESATIALTLYRSRAASLGLDPRLFDGNDLHIHVPAGATPKDGPSAGVSMFTAIVSLAANLPPRKAIAMTGEITLRGRVLPIGGVKEKTLAAARAGIQTVILPEENRRDFAEVDPEVKKKLVFKFVANVDDLLREAIPALGLPPSKKAPGKHKDC